MIMVNGRGVPQLMKMASGFEETWLVTVVFFGDEYSLNCHLEGKGGSEWSSQGFLFATRVTAGAQCLHRPIFSGGQLSFFPFFF